MTVISSRCHESLTHESTGFKTVSLPETSESYKIKKHICFRLAKLNVKASSHDF